MAKKKSSIDAALEVARKIRVPKKPVKARGKKTVPSKLDWGPGIPEDKLAYLNDDEMALVQANRMFKGKRSVNGVPAFPDPKDTGAGDNSRLPDGGGGAGTGGRPGGGGGQPGSSAPGAGGASKGTSSGAGGASAGTESKPSGTTSAPAGGPTGGPTSAPARTEPSRAATPPSTFGPRSSSMPGTPVSTAPSTAAYEGALSRIAQGSSVIGSPSNVKQITDRVPQATPTATKYSQGPTVGPNRGLGGISAPREDLTVGANSPFASPGLAGYDPNKYNQPSPASSVPSNVVGPSVPVGTALQKDPYFGAEQAALRYGSAAPMPSIGVNPASYSSPIGPSKVGTPVVSTDPRVAQTPIGSYPASIPMDPSFAGRAADAQTLGEQLAFASGAAANTIGNYLGSTAQNVGNYVGSLFGGSPTTQVAATTTDVYKTPQFTEQRIGRGQKVNAEKYGTAPQMPGDYSAYRQAQAEQAFANNAIGVGAPSVETPEKIQDRLNVSTPYGSYSSEQVARMSAEDQQRLNELAQTPTYTPPDIVRPVNYGFVNPATNMVASAPVGLNPTPASVPGTPVEVAYNNVPFSQGDYVPSQAPAYDMSPSQQSGLTQAQRDEYLGSLGGSRQEPVRPIFPASPARGGGSGKKAPTQYLKPLPPWVDYSYLYTDYPEIGTPSPNISAFNDYTATMRRGGRVGDSVDAALRLARQPVVSRTKTR